MEKEKIVVLIPCYNEETTIVKVIRDFNKYLPNAAIYVYDNNSTDKSYELASKEKCIVRKCLKQGKGYVIIKMFNEIDATCYLIVDGDDTYPAKDAKKMCNMVINDGYDMVVGDRLSTTYFKENKKVLNSFGNVLVKILIKILFRYNVCDVLSGYRAFSRNFVKNISILSNKFEVETEITISSIVNNNNICFVPIKYKDRKRGSVSKIRGVRDGISILYTVLMMYREYKPKRYYLLFSLLFILLAIILNNKYGIICFIISICFYCIGIILDYILKFYMRLLDVNRRN